MSVYSNPDGCIKLWGLHYEIVYCKGSDNTVVDSLSR